MPPSKTALREELADELGRVLEGLQRAHRATLEGVTHEDAKPENDKDTRALEQSYLARGQARRVEELEADIARLQALGVGPFGGGARIVMGALVTVEEEGRTQLYFVAPNSGSGTLARGAVRVVTPPSPLGRALLGKVAGEEFEVVLPGRTRQLCIVAVE